MDLEDALLHILPTHITTARAVIYIASTVLQDPFDHLYRDHDVEGMSDG